MTKTFRQRFEDFELAEGVFYNNASGREFSVQLFLFVSQRMKLGVFERKKDAMVWKVVLNTQVAKIAAYKCIFGNLFRHPRLLE